MKGDPRGAAIRNLERMGRPLAAAVRESERYETCTPLRSHDHLLVHASDCPWAQPKCSCDCTPVTLFFGARA